MTHQFNGPYGDQGDKGGPGRNEKHVKVNGTKGVMRQRRTEKREEADARNALTPPERRRKYRLSMYDENGKRVHGTETN